jgi:hypothetical protein
VTNILATVRLIKAEDGTGTRVYRVMVDGQQLGVVWRDEGTTSGYWGAWRGSTASNWPLDEDGTPLFIAGSGSIRGERRGQVVSEIAARASTSAAPAASEKPSAITREASTQTSGQQSATRTRTVPRPADVPADVTGHLVDVETGERLVCWQGRQDGEYANILRGWILRWRTGHGGRTGHSVRFERYEMAG